MHSYYSYNKLKYSSYVFGTYITYTHTYRLTGSYNLSARIKNDNASKWKQCKQHIPLLAICYAWLLQLAIH